MTVVVLFFVVVGLGAVAWYVVTKRRARADQWLVSNEWIANHRHNREGDLPPGTSRQEEGK